MSKDNPAQQLRIDPASQQTAVAITTNVDQQRPTRPIPRQMGIGSIRVGQAGTCSEQ
jgi:hypothetical protein